MWSLRYSVNWHRQRMNGQGRRVNGVRIGLARARKPAVLDTHDRSAGIDPRPAIVGKDGAGQASGVLAAPAAASTASKP